MVVRFELATVIPTPPEAIFELSLSVDAHLDSFAHTRERAIAGVLSGQLGHGDRVTWRARHFGLPLTMSVQITELERPVRFVDEQTRGPFRFYRHEHRFEAIEAGTRMRDSVSFAAPLGVLGIIAERLVLARYMKRLIERRNAALVARV